MDSDEIPVLGRQLAEIVTIAMDEIRPILTEAALAGHHGERTNERHTDNFLSKHDLWMHQRYKDLLLDRLGSFVYASEEGDPEVLGSDTDPDLCILVDPLDTSELAVRALNGYTHVLAYSRAQSRPVAAVVGDIFHHVQLYIAATDGAHDVAFTQTRDGNLRRLDATGVTTRDLTDSIVTMFLMKRAERFIPLADQTRLLEALSKPNSQGQAKGRIGVDFGSVGLCHVAAGFTDAMVEFTKGFAVWDLAPGHYILHAAGGIVTHLDGSRWTSITDCPNSTRSPRL
jgi:myo-inositol-1(or 4)-monophosphatase